MILDAAGRIEAPPEERALPLRRHQKADALRRIRDGGEADLERGGQGRLPGSAARPELGIAQILAQHQQALRVGFDTAIVARQRDQKLDRPGGRDREFGRQPGGFIVERIPGLQEGASLQPGLAAEPLRPGGLLVEVTDGTDDYNAGHYRLSPFYDLAKVAVIRMAWAHAKDLAPHGATSVSLTPGWLRSEAMLEIYGVGEENWRDGARTEPHFVISETPRFVGRAVAALAADPEHARWNGQSLSSGGLAKVYGFTDLDGSRPDAWRYLREVQDAGKPADATGYR